MDDEPRRLAPSFRALVVALLATAAGAAYGLTGRLLLSKPEGVWAAMSIAFIFVMPFSMGFLATAICWIGGPLRWYARLTAPIAGATLALAICMAMNLEGAICIAIWSPLYMTLVVTGALMVEGIFQIRRAIRRRTQTFLCVFVGLLPYATGVVESFHERTQEVRVVAESATIRAPATIVWSEIREVRRIDDSERHDTFTHAIGFPRPVEARLVGEGIGATRVARFEGNVLFIETIRAWDPGRLLSFSIRADTEAIPATTLDEHVKVGGPYFDVLEGRFEIVPLQDGAVRLDLTSRHRLGTPFNFYAGLWTDFIMRDIQREILRIIRDRCEARAQRGDSPPA
ncbi:MAG: hypothetical protein U0167_00150 [bacterium]